MPFDLPVHIIGFTPSLSNGRRIEPFRTADIMPYPEWLACRAVFTIASRAVVEAQLAMAE